MNIKERKTLLRQEIEVRIAAIPTSERDEERADICSQLLARIPATAVVCGYMPLQTEVDIQPLLEKLLQRKQEVYLPRYEEGHVVFQQISSLQTLEHGRYNILVPARDAPALQDGNADIVLVPGRAFDLHGNRLGRGGGGYDRWIALQRKANPETQFFGIAFACQIIPDVPVEPHDQRVDEVITALSF